MQELERRENPAIPFGLTDFSSLLGLSNSAPSGYAETHSIVRNETNSVTVDQAGTGSSGTFTVTVDGSNQSSDTASGSAAGSNAITATGTGSNQSTSHQVLSGTYANGAFTITSETYSESGSYSSALNTTTTYSYESGSSTNESDSTRSGTYSLSYTATAGSYGMLNYTSYDYTASDAAHSFTSNSSSGGGLYETTTDSAYTVHTIGSGSTATYTGIDASSGTTHMSYLNPDGTPYDYTSSYSSSNPISGTTYLMPQYESTYGMEWQAGTSTATGFTFHGVATQDATLTESLTSHPSYFGASVDVNSFSSTSHTSDSGHVVDDEPGTPASGTELFHRDETSAYTDDATGSGSYIGGVADATFHVVQAAAYSMADESNVRNAVSTETDDDGEPVGMTFNYLRNVTGVGSLAHTYDVHDTGSGSTMTGETLVAVRTELVVSHAWGTLAGAAFDNVGELAIISSATLIPDSATQLGNAPVLNSESFLAILRNRIGFGASVPQNLQPRVVAPQFVMGGGAPDSARAKLLDAIAKGEAAEIRAVIQTIEETAPQLLTGVTAFPALFREDAISMQPLLGMALERLKALGSQVTMNEEIGSEFGR